MLYVWVRLVTRSNLSVPGLGYLNVILRKKCKPDTARKNRMHASGAATFIGGYRFPRITGKPTAQQNKVQALVLIIKIIKIITFLKLYVFNIINLNFGICL